MLHVSQSAHGGAVEVEILMRWRDMVVELRMDGSYPGTVLRRGQLVGGRDDQRGAIRQRLHPGKGHLPLFNTL